MACLLTAYDIEPENDTCLRMIRDCMVQILLMQKEGKQMPKSMIKQPHPHPIFEFSSHLCYTDMVLEMPERGGPTAKDATTSGFATSIYGPTIHGPTIYGPTIHGPTIYGPTIYGPTIYGPTIYGRLADPHVLFMYFSLVFSS